MKTTREEIQEKLMDEYENDHYASSILHTQHQALMAMRPFELLCEQIDALKAEINQLKNRNDREDDYRSEQSERL